jgi:hypothetical protein
MEANSDITRSNRYFILEAKCMLLGSSVGGNKYGIGSRHCFLCKQIIYCIFSIIQIKYR